MSLDYKLIKTECPLIHYQVPNHEELKPKIIEAIRSMGTHSLIEPSKNQVISNTDWHLSNMVARPYYNLINDVVEDTCKIINTVFNIPDKLYVGNFWFQEYNLGDYHNWHIHGAAMFSNVYYVSLPEGSSYTSFNFNGVDFDVPVTEGSVLTFPSFYRHCSKKQKTDETKVSIVFNI